MPFVLQTQSNRTETLTSRAICARTLETITAARRRLACAASESWYAAISRAQARMPTCDSALFDSVDRSHRAAADIRVRQRCNQLNGRAIAEALATLDATAMIGLEVEPALMSSRLADFLIDNDLQPCDECSEIHAHDDMHPVDNGDRTLCQSCLESEEYVFCSDVDDFRQQSDVYHAIDYRGDSEYFAVLPDGYEQFPEWHYHDGSYFDSDYADSFGLYWSERSDEWVDEDTYYEESREPEREGVYEYHCHPYRYNRSYFHETSTKVDPAIGLEIEVNADGDIYDALTSNDLDWILEQDISLDSERGVEVISPPITVSRWASVSATLAEAFSEADCEGHDAGSGYGIHATVHRRHLSELQETRMALFFGAKCNSRFVDTIAQRRTIYSGERNQAPKPKTCDVAVKKAASNGKFSPLHFKGDLCECRVFRSNTRADRILKNVQFFGALIAWTSREACTGTSYHWADFAQWLCDPVRAKQYSVLYQYLDAQTPNKLHTEETS